MGHKQKIAGGLLRLFGGDSPLFGLMSDLPAI